MTVVSGARSVTFEARRSVGGEAFSNCRRHYFLLCLNLRVAATSFNFRQFAQASHLHRLVAEGGALEKNLEKKDMIFDCKGVVSNVQTMNESKLRAMPYQHDGEVE
jgi:hypothetical protein